MSSRKLYIHTTYQDGVKKYAVVQYLNFGNRKTLFIGTYSECRNFIDKQ